jgi:hypothetical protein
MQHYLCRVDFLPNLFETRNQLFYFTGETIVKKLAKPLRELLFQIRSDREIGG